MQEQRIGDINTHIQHNGDYDIKIKATIQRNPFAQISAQKMQKRKLAWNKKQVQSAR